MNQPSSAGSAPGLGLFDRGLVDHQARAVVRRVLRDRDVVRMALAQPGGRDPDEAGARLHLLDRRGAAVAHRLPEAADDLVDDARQRALVRHAALDALGHELVGPLVTSPWK